ncbi:MAG: hypothetical protein LVR00_05260 [Rhabdochlamydiaceae bacterium]|jgi:acetyl-CoA carboxylase carboxyl transferase subunit alpha
MTILAHEKQILEYEETIAKVKEQNKNNALWSTTELKKLEDKLTQLKKKVYSNLSPWERVAICRHPKRPHAIDFIKNICEEFVEVCGDRLFRDDPAVITGFATIGGVKYMLIAQEREMIQKVVSNAILGCCIQKGIVKPCGPCGLRLNLTCRCFL